MAGHAAGMLIGEADREAPKRFVIGTSRKAKSQVLGTKAPVGVDCVLTSSPALSIDSRF